MNTKIQAMNDTVLKIQKLAQAKLGNPQVLYKKLQEQTVNGMKYGYSSNLMLATGSSGVDIKNSFKDTHGIPYTHIDDKRIYRNLWNSNEKRLINLHIPKNDLYIVCDNVPIRANDNGDLVVRYRPLNYHDIYNATERFFEAEHQLNNQQLVSTKHAMLHKVAHDGRVGQHDFIREALDDLFTGINLNHQTGQVEFSQMLAYNVSNAITDKSFHTTSHYYNYCYWLPELLLGGKFALVGAQKLHDTKAIHAYQKKLWIIKHLQAQHLEYLVYKFNHRHKIVSIHKVTKLDMKYIIQSILNYLKTL